MENSVNNTIIPIKIYVAGKWSDKTYINSIIDHLEQLGYSITHNWTKVENVTRDPISLGEMAILDINGVKNADALLVSMTDPDYAYRGTFTEIGCALALDKKIIIVSSDIDQTIKTPYYSTNCFYHHPNIIHVKKWTDAIECLKNLVLEEIDD